MGHIANDTLGKTTAPPMGQFFLWGPGLLLPACAGVGATLKKKVTSVKHNAGGLIIAKQVYYLVYLRSMR